MSTRTIGTLVVFAFLVLGRTAESASCTAASNCAGCVGSAGGWQPLCALYHRQFAEVAEKALQQKRYKIDSLFAEVPVLSIEEAEILQAGFSPRMFDNLNTREEFELAQRRAQ